MMPQISHMTASEIKSLWGQYRQRFDEVGYARNVLDEFLSQGQQKQGIVQAGRAFRILENRYPSFFERFPYKWIVKDAFDSFDLSVEASFQIRLIELMMPLWEVVEEHPIESEMFGDILVRQPVIPATLHASPQAVDIGGHGGIMMPQGWFDSMHYSFESARAHLEGGEEASIPYILELIARALADLSIKKVHDQNFSLSVHQTIPALSRPNVVSAITKRHDAFNGAIGDLSSLALPGLWGELAYATTTFALGHEASHILTGEHKKRMDQADEHRADGVAFDMLVQSVAWQQRCPELLAISPIAKTSIATSGFLFVNWLRISMDQILTLSDSDREKRFIGRAEHIQNVAAVQQFSSNEREIVTKLGVHLTKTRDHVTRILMQISPFVKEAIDIGMKEYGNVLKEQAKLGLKGGVEGL